MNEVMKYNGIEIIDENFKEIADNLIGLVEKGPCGFTNIITVPGNGWKSPRQFIKEDILPRFSKETVENLKSYVTEEYVEHENLKTLLEIIG